MNLLRATVRKTGDWWEVKLIDLKVVADGESESAMLRQLEYVLTAEYHLATRFARTPFVGLLRSVPTQEELVWCDGDKNFRQLNLPVEVRRAISAVFNSPTVTEFTLRDEAGNCKTAKAA